MDVCAEMKGHPGEIGGGECVYSRDVCAEMKGHPEEIGGECVYDDGMYVQK